MKCNVPETVCAIDRHPVVSTITEAQVQGLIYYNKQHSMQLLIICMHLNEQLKVPLAWMNKACMDDMNHSTYLDHVISRILQP